MKSINKAIVAIVIPVTLQTLLLSSNSLLDNFMISKLGTAAVAAAGSANKYMGILKMTIFSMSAANAILTSQLKNKSRKGIVRSIFINTFVSLLISLIFILHFIFNKDAIISGFSSDVSVQMLAREYLSVSIFSSITLSLLSSFVTSIRSLGKVHFPLIMNILIVIANFFFNIALIYGKWGFPSMGVKGAASATLIAEIIGIIISIIGIIIFKYPIIGKMKDIYTIPLSFIKKYLKLALPMLATGFMRSLSLLLSHNIFGKLGKDALAAYGVISPIEMIFAHMFIGFGSAGLILVGKELGQNNFDEAYKKSKRLSILGLYMSLGVGLVIFFSSGLISSLYSNMTPTALKYVRQMIQIYAFFLWVKVFNSISFKGTLSSGGDSIFIFMVRTLSTWAYMLPAIYVGYNFLNWSLTNIYIAINISEVLMAIAVFYRIRSKKWMKNLTE